MSTVDVTNLQQVSNYSTLLLQSNLSNNVYFLDNTDTSGYVFEINAFDTSGSLPIDPTFDTLIQQNLGFQDCSAIAVLDVSLSAFNSLFSFESDSDDLDDLSVNDLKFGLNTAAGSLFSDICYSYADVVESMVNSVYSEQQIYHDYIRNVAKQITGGYSAADIFTNEEELVEGVKTLDLTFQQLFTSIISTLINETNTLGHKGLDEIGTLSAAEYSSVYRAAIALFTINANSGATHERLLTLFDDIRAASADYVAANGTTPSSIVVPIRFHSGDKVALRLVYKNTNTTPLGNNSIDPRSYKLLLNLV
jgi:hypothetical protein